MSKQKRTGTAVLPKGGARDELRKGAKRKNTAKRSIFLKEYEHASKIIFYTNIII